jgi:hypothetical protein
MVNYQYSCEVRVGTYSHDQNNDWKVFQDPQLVAERLLRATINQAGNRSGQAYWLVISPALGT